MNLGGRWLFLIGVASCVFWTSASNAASQAAGDPGDLIAPEIPGFVAEGEAPIPLTAAEYIEFAGVDAPPGIVDEAEAAGFRAAIRRFLAGDEVVVILALQADGEAADFLEGFIGETSTVVDASRGVRVIDDDGHGAPLSGIAYAHSPDEAVALVGLGSVPSDLLAAAEEAQLSHTPVDRSLTSQVDDSGDDGLAYTVGRIAGFVALGALAIFGIVSYRRRQQRDAAWGVLPPPPSSAPPPPPPDGSLNG